MLARIQGPTGSFQPKSCCATRVALVGGRSLQLRTIRDGLQNASSAHIGSQPTASFEEAQSCWWDAPRRLLSLDWAHFRAFIVYPASGFVIHH